ncbi:MULTISPECIES: YtzI protein [Bacillus]|nr:MULTISPECIES: YtzI protein [Bacillus]
MIPILVICIIIVFAVILISVLTTSKAYKYKHTIDPHPSDTIDDSHDQ